MSKKPAILFYTGDWLKDPRLGKCSPATRGIWMDCLCLMHEDDQSGVLSGRRAELERILRCNRRDFARFTDDLRLHKFADFIVHQNRYTIINRRMQREKAVSEARSEAGKRGMANRWRNKSITKSITKTAPSTPTSISSSFVKDNANHQHNLPVGDGNVQDSRKRGNLGLACSNYIFDLGLDLEIDERVKSLSATLESLFFLSSREKKTFAIIIKHLVYQVQIGRLKLPIFDAVAEWARAAAKSNVRNKKGLFVAKVKKETGFKASKKLL